MSRCLLVTCAVFAMVAIDGAYADCTSSTPTAIPTGPACSAPDADCGCLVWVTAACQPTGNILAAFATRGGCAKFGPPLLTARPRLAFRGTYQQFARGEIAAYPRWATEAQDSMPAFVLSAADMGAKIEVEWDSTGPYIYEWFVLRWDRDDNAENVKAQHDDHKQQKDTDAISGHHGKDYVDVTENATYVIYVEGCKKGGLFMGADCAQGWSYPVYIDHLLQMPVPIPHPPLASPVIPTGILDVPDQVRLTTSQVVGIVKDLCGIALIDTDGEHEGEVATDPALARLHASSFGWSCGSTSWQTLRADVNKALREAKVASRPGTNIEWLIRTLVGAISGALLGVVLGAAAMTLLGGAPSVIGIIATVVGAALGALFGAIGDKPGDYDMRLTGLIQIVHRFPSALSPGTRERVINDLLTARGGADERHDYVWFLGLPTPVLETENHVWMTESARFLTNNLIAAEYTKKGQAVPKQYDNDKNGMTDWMLAGTRRFLTADFYELNSRPYATYIAKALQNLADFGAYGIACTQVVPAGAAPSPRRCDVRRAARSVLDFLATKFAVSSNELRRAAPFRRQPPFRDYPRLLTNGGDDLSWRYFEFTGGSRFVAAERDSRIAEFAPAELMVAFQSDYAPPVVVTDLIRSTATPTSTSFERVRNTNRDSDVVEIYYREPSFLITAGGKYDRGAGVAGLGSLLGLLKGEDAWALPTTLMPTKQGNDYRDFVRILGHTNDSNRINTCVAPGFACGMNPVLPLGLPAACTKQSGNWTFIDFDANTAACPFGYGFYVALYRKECSEFTCVATAGDAAPGTFGFFEATPYRSFSAYMDAVLAANGNWNYEFNKINVYMRPTGGRVTFALDADDKHWGIVDYDVGNGVVTPERRYDKWPIASGDVLNAPLEGCITVDNQHLKQQLILDHTNANRPRRTIVTLPPPRGCTCPLPDACISPRSE